MTACVSARWQLLVSSPGHSLMELWSCTSATWYPNVSRQYHWLARCPSNQPIRQYLQCQHHPPHRLNPGRGRQWAARGVIKPSPDNRGDYIEVVWCMQVLTGRQVRISTEAKAIVLILRSLKMSVSVVSIPFLYIDLPWIYRIFCQSNTAGTRSD